MFWTAPKLIVARKPHKCCVCPDPIEAGTTYLRWFCADDSGGQTVKLHLGCDCLRELYSDDDGIFDGHGKDLLWALDREPWQEVEQQIRHLGPGEIARVRRLWEQANDTAPADAGRKEE